MNISFDFQKKIGLLFYRGVMLYWYRYYKLIFLGLFCIVLAVAGYQWYYSLHRYAWSEEQKKAYVEAHFKETGFHEAEFRELTERLRKRASEHSAGLELRRNIFTGEIIGN